MQVTDKAIGDLGLVDSLAVSFLLSGIKDQLQHVVYYIYYEFVEATWILLTISFYKVPFVVLKQLSLPLVCKVT